MENEKNYLQNHERVFDNDEKEGRMETINIERRERETTNDDDGKFNRKRLKKNIRKDEKKSSNVYFIVVS